MCAAAALARRAHDLGIVTESGYRKLNIEMSGLGWRTNEPDPLAAEVPHTVPALVEHAVQMAGGLDAAAVLAGTTSSRFVDWLCADITVNTSNTSAPGSIA
jgi:hypothetical protein